MIQWAAATNVYKNVYKYAHAKYEPMIYTHDMHLTISRYFYAHFDAMIHPQPQCT